MMVIKVIIGLTLALLGVFACTIALMVGGYLAIRIAIGLASWIDKKISKFLED